MQVSLNGMLQSAADGAEAVEVEADTVDELLAALVSRYPKFQKHIDEGVAVAINGEIYRDDGTRHIPKDAEVFLIPRIAGG